MSQGQTTRIMVFVVGLFLMASGILLATMTQTVTKYRNYYGIDVPYQDTIHPYEIPGWGMAIVGFIILVFVIINKEQNIEAIIQALRT